MPKFVRPNIRKGSGRTFPLVLAGIVLVVGIGVSLLIAYLEYGTAAGRERESVGVRLDSLQSALSAELQSSVYLARGMVSIIELQGTIRAADLDRVASQLVAHGPAVRDIGVARGTVVQYVYPLAGNERAIGLDYRSIPEQWRTVKQAIDERRTVVAGPVALVQGGTGIVTRTPVFLNDKEGKERYWGMVSVVIDFPALIRSAGLNRPDLSLRVALRGADGLGAEGPVFWGDPDVIDSRPVVRDVVLPSGSWQIAAIPAGGWQRFHLFRSSFFYIGIVFTLLLVLLLVKIASANRELRSERARLLDVIEFFPEATFIVDRRGQVVAWNHAMETLTGVDSSEIIGRGDHAYGVPFYGSQGPMLIDLIDQEVEEVEARYDYVRRTKSAVHAEGFVAKLNGGKGRYLWAVAAPLIDPRGVRFGSIEVIRDITEVKATERALQQAVSLQQAILDSTADGILSVDRNNEIVSFNRRFVDLWRIPDTLLDNRRPGSVLEHVMSMIRDPAAFRNTIQQLSGQTDELSEDQVELLDGRILSRYSRPQVHRGEIVGRVWTFRDDTGQIRASERLRESVHEKDVLLREIHHRVKNNLQVVVSLLSLQSSRIRDPLDAEIFKASKQRVLAMALVHEVLYQNENLASIRMNDYVPRLVSSLQKTYGSISSRVTIHAEVEPIELDVERAMPCALIINELVSNALKHAFDPETGGRIGLTLSRDAGGTASLVVEDDGRGYSAGKSPEGEGSSFGLLMVDVLVRQIHGTLSIESTRGTRVVLHFPTFDPGPGDDQPGQGQATGPASAS
ncbi:histidine kinase dimerization/phosphoacceptor domain -containing protein [Salinispira pacifica]